MATRAYRTRKAVSDTGKFLQEKAWTVGRDPRRERRLRWAWGALAGALGAIATIAARRVTGRVWTVLTGEEPPRRA